MSLNRDYKIKFDLQKNDLNKTNIVFCNADVGTSDFSMYIRSNGELIDITDTKGTLYIVTPSRKKMNIEVENRGDHFYILLPSEYIAEVGKYRAVLSLVKGTRRTILNEFEYKVI